MSSNRTNRYAWAQRLLVFLAVLVGAPLAHAANTDHMVISGGWSLDPTCFDVQSDFGTRTVTSGTTVYLCIQLQNISNVNISNAKAFADGVQVGTGQTLLIGKKASYVRAAQVATASQTPRLTGTGLGADGTNFVAGVGNDIASLVVVNPSLSIQKTVSTSGTCPGVENVTVVSGTQVKECYTVTNNGDTTVSGVVVTDTGVSLSVGTLAPGASSTVSSAVTATSNSSTTAIAGGTNTTTNQPVASPPDGASIQVVSPALTIATTVTTGNTCPGQEIVNVLTATPLKWCYTVTNNGNTAVDGISISDDTLGPLGNAPFSLSPGQSITLSRGDTSTFDETLTAHATGTATASGTQVNSNLDPAAVNVVGPKIDIDVTVSTNGTCPGTDTATVAAGTSVVYCYNVSNIGDDELDNVDVLDGNNNPIGYIASLVPGQSHMFTGPLTQVNGDGNESGLASGTDPYGFGVTATDLAKVHALFPGISIQKTVSTSGTCPGTELVTVLQGTGVTYCYVVTNTGDTAISSVAVNDAGGEHAFFGGTLAPGQSTTLSASAQVWTDENNPATATGTNAPTGQPITSAPDTAAVDVVSPSLSIQKTVSTNGMCPGIELVTVLSGDAVTYCYTVTNNGDTPVSNISVSDNGVTIPVGDLAPGASTTTGQVVTAIDDTDTPATASGTATATGSPVGSQPDGAAVDVVHPALSVQKTVSTTGSCTGIESVTVVIGTPVVYCYQITNTGDVAIGGITVEDNGNSIGVPDLNPGENAYTSRPIVALADEDTAAIALGTSLPTNSPVQSNLDDASVHVVNPSLAIQKTVSTNGTCPGSEQVTVLSGSVVTYCYSVTNTGDAEIDYVAVSDNGADVPVGNLLPGQTSTGTYTLPISQNTNTPAIAAGIVPVASNYSVYSPPDGAEVDVVHPALTIQKTVSTSGTCPGVESVTVLNGSAVTYCYTVTNSGDTAVSNITVNDNGASISIGNLAAGASGSGSVQVSVTSDADTFATASGTTTVTNTPVSSGPDDASVHVVNPALSIQKTVSANGTCPGAELVTVLSGTAVTYCYAVTNTGDTAISGVVVSDGNINVSIGTLAAGASGNGAASYTALADTNTPAVASGTTVVTGTSIASPPDGAAIDVVTPALSIATTVSTNGQCPGLEVVNVLAGTDVTRCYVVTNTGDTTVTGIAVTDDNYGLVPGTIATLAPGQSATESLHVSANTDVTINASAGGTVAATGTGVQSPQDAAVINVVSPNIDIDVTVSTSGTCPGADTVSVPAGTSVVYCYKVTNNGDDILSDVKVTDGAQNLIADLTDIGPGASQIITGAPVTVLGDQTVPATASGTDAYGFPVSDSDTALVHALFAHLQIQKTVSLNGACPGTELVTVLSGTAVTYCYLVTNTGNTAVTGIAVSDNGASVAVGDLAPGQSATVSRGITATGSEDTFATAIGLNPYTHQAVKSAPDDAAVAVVHPSLSIDKTASLNGACPGQSSVTVLQGTTVTYCYAVTNNGDTTVGDIHVTDTGVDLPVGTLASGQSATVSTTIVAGPVDIDTFAAASGTDTATWTKVTSPQDDALIDVIHPALSIATTVSTNGQCPGQEVVNVLANTAVKWCYVVTNTGDVAVSGISVSDDKFSGSLPAGSLGAGQSVTLSRPATATVDVTLTATAAGHDALINTPVQSNPDSAVVNVVNPSIDIDVTVSTTGSCPGADAVTVTAGTSVVYCYKVTNIGDDTLSSIVVKDQNGNTVTTIGSLAAGASSTYKGPASTPMADASATGNVSAVDVYGFPVSDTDTALVHVLYANLRIVKTAPAHVTPSQGGGGCGGGGSQSTPLAYSISVSNLGQATAVHPVVTDVIPSGESYVSATTTSGTCSYSSSTGKVTCTLANMAPGASASITINVNVSAQNGSITNTATVTSTTPDSDSSDNSSSATTAVGSGATRTLGFYANHPNMTLACLNAIGGTMDIGWFQIRDETHDNEIDAVAAGNGPDKDKRVETGISMVMGILNANVDHYTNNAKRTALEQTRMQAAKQLVTAICNAQYLNTPPPFSMSGYLAAMKGTNQSLMLQYANQADTYNNSGDNISLPVDPGPANSKYPWDDPTDPND